MTQGNDKPIAPLLANVYQILAAHQGIFRQARVFWRVVALFFGEVFTFGRHTVTQGLLALGLTDADWSAWYRLFSQGRFDAQKAGEVMLRQTLAHVPVEAPYVIAGDGVKVYRHSQKMPGTAWTKGARTAPFQPGLERAQRFVDISWLPPMEGAGWTRAIPLLWRPAFPEKAVPAAVPPKKEWEAVVEGIKWVRERLDAAGREAQDVLCVVDGGIERAVAFWEQVPERTFVLARTARNRVLHELPSPSPTSKRGPKPKYGVRARTPGEWLHVKEGWQKTTLMVRGRLRVLQYRVEGPYLRRGLPGRFFFLLVVRGRDVKRGKRRIRRKPAFFLVLARWDGERWVLPYEAETLLLWAWQRWEVEVEHREVKSGLGLGEKQCWHPLGTIVAVQWSAWVYGVLMLAGYRTWGICGGPAPLGRWQKGVHRWSIRRLWRAVRAAIWDLPELRAVYLGTPNNWPQKSDYLAGLWNAIQAAARV